MTPLSPEGLKKARGVNASFQWNGSSISATAFDYGIQERRSSIILRQSEPQHSIPAIALIAGMEPEVERILH